MASWIEKLISREQGVIDRDTRRVVFSYHVFDVGPDEAYQKAQPPLPKMGDSLKLSRGSIRNVLRGFPPVQVRKIDVMNHPDNPGDSLVFIEYRSGPDWKETSRGVRKVLWDTDIGVDTERRTHDLDTGLELPGGPIEVPVATVDMTALIEGTWISLSLFSLAGTVNDAPFRAFPAGYVQYLGADTELMQGSDAALGFTFDPTRLSIARVRLRFRAKRTGWFHREPTIDSETGVKTGETKFRIMEESDFRSLFANNLFDPGSFTFGAPPMNLP